MAEDLTGFLAEHGVRVRLPAIRTSTRSSGSKSSGICAPACSTWWSASTCCARAWICPRSGWLRSSTRTRKVSFRSERSLIQTIGRAARHLNGTAILYADSITNSMRRAIDETDRRRVRQTEFTVCTESFRRAFRKQVKELIDGVY